MFFWGPYDSYDYDDGVDRRGWAEKSDAALKREREAKELFHNSFLPDAKKATTFPFTIEDLVPPTMHLTDACWRDFKKEVTRYGCTTKRRVISAQEKSALKSNARKSKMYTISVTTPVHPDQAVKASKVKKEKSAAAKKKREELAKRRAEEDSRKRLEEKKEEADLTALVDQEFAKLEQILKAKSEGSNLKKRSIENIDAGKAEQDPAKQTEPQADPAESPSKKTKVDSTSCTNITFKFTVPVSRLVQKADYKFKADSRKIQLKVTRDKEIERVEFMKELNAKWEKVEKAATENARAYRDNIKSLIETHASNVGDKKRAATNSDVTAAKKVATAPPKRVDAATIAQ